MIKKNAVVALLAATTLATSAVAGDFQQQLKQCAQEKDSLSRLLCYDRLAQSVDSATKVADVAPVAKVSAPEVKEDSVTNAASVAEQAKTATPSNFGIEHKHTVGKSDEMTMTIAKMSKDVYGKWRFTFENGQVWHQSDGSTPPRLSVGDEVTIKRGVFNSFFLSKAGVKRNVRVKRIK